MDYVPNTKDDREVMLRDIHVSSIRELFKDIPSNLLLTQPLNIKQGLSELELRKHITNLSEKNTILPTNFLGAGSYYHFVPSVVDHILRRGEFFTAYTPYQPELSQGMLQAIYEYQTIICDLTGMDVSNASMYDGSTALAEAMLMSVAITERNEIVVLSSVHPEYRKVLKTYADARDLKLIELAYDDDFGTTKLLELNQAINDKTACVIVQNPNFFGCIEPLQEIEKIVHDKKALFVVNIGDITSLGIINPPGKYNADIVTGEAQCFALPPSFGGPSLGVLCCKKEYVRKLPGRIVGMTKDESGERGFVLTLQAREQHIRREKATSNICTNQGLIMLGSLIGLCTLGKKGLRRMAEISATRANYMRKRMNDLDNFSTVYSAPFYNEFVVKCRDADDALDQLKKNNIIGGLNLGKFYAHLDNHLLFCVTEMISKDEIHRVLDILREL